MNLNKINQSKINSMTPNAMLGNMVDLIGKTNAIDPELYNEHNVKLGIRNKNGTDVIAGLTRIGEVHGYDKYEEGNKISEEGELCYRDYRVKDLVKPIWWKKIWL